MSNSLLKWAMAAVATGFTVLPTHAQNIPELNAEQKDQIRQIVTKDLGFTPKKTKHRVLVFWKTEGFVHHHGIAGCNEAIRTMAQLTGAFSADFSNDYEDLRAEKLKQYDAVVLNNTTQLKTREHDFIVSGLIDFVKSGKGLAVMHAGADNFYDAPEAAEMVGGRFWGHPWGSGGTWAFHLDDAGNAINAPFGGKDFKVSDEIYMQQPPFYNRAKLRVLVSLDLNDPATHDAKGQRRTDNDYAVSWIRPYGKGRVFYSSFGHDARGWTQSATGAHMLRGLLYTLGDFNADDTPTGFCPAAIANMKAATDELPVYNQLQDAAIHTYSDKVAFATADEAANTLLSAPDASAAAKNAALRFFIGRQPPKDLNAVAACTKSAETSFYAVSLLAQTPGTAAAKALAGCWDGASRELRCSILNAFAIRGESAFVVSHCADPDCDVATAAIRALGRIGDAAAVKALSAKLENPALEDARQTALGAALAAGGNTVAAKAVYGDAALPEYLRATAARTLMLENPGFFDTAIKDESLLVRQTVIREAGRVKTASLIKALDESIVDRPAIIARLTDNGDKAALPAIAAQLASADETTVLEAVAAVSKLGGDKEAETLVSMLGREGSVGNAVGLALRNMAGIGPKLIAQAENNPALIAILGDRAETALIPKWKSLLQSKNEEIRKESWKALGKNAVEQNLDLYLSWLPLVQEPELTLAGNTIRAAARNVTPDDRTAKFKAAWEKCGDTPRRLLADNMGTYASDAFLDSLYGGLKSGDTQLRQSVLETLSKWDSLAPLAEIEKCYKENNELRQDALRAANRLIAAKAGNETPAKITELFKLAADSDRTRVAENLFRSTGLGAFKTLEGMFADPACGASAKKAYVEVFDRFVKNGDGGESKEIDRRKWRAAASHNGRDVKNAFDGKGNTRWSSSTPSRSGMWFVVDMGATYTVGKAILDTTSSANDTPNGCEAFISADGKTWSGPVGKVDGNTKNVTEIPMSATGRFIRFVCTGDRDGLYWSIHELRLMSGLDKNAVEQISKVADTLR